MSIKKISQNFWFVRARVRINGKILSATQKVNGTREDALAVDLELKKNLRVDKKETCSLTIKTLADALRFYKDHTEADMTRIECLFNKLERDLGSVNINQLSEKFSHYLLLLKKEKAFWTGEEIKVSTRNKLLGYAKIALNFCLKRGLIERNPLAHFEKLPEIGRDRILSRAERVRLLRTLKREKSYLYWPVRFSERNPIRKSDLCNLTIDNLDLFKPWIHFQASKTKKVKPRETCLPFLDEAIVRYLQRLPSNCIYLFPRGCEGEEWKPLGDFKNHWHTMLEKAKIEDFHWHDLKHCAITWILDNGYTERDLKNLGIQYSSQMIDRYYKHDAGKVLKKWKSTQSGTSVASKCGFKVQKTA